MNKKHTSQVRCATKGRRTRKGRKGRTAFSSPMTIISISVKPGMTGKLPTVADLATEVEQGLRKFRTGKPIVKPVSRWYYL